MRKTTSVRDGVCKLRVVHVITGLSVGGAERMLLGLSVAGPEAGFNSVVICLGPRGPVSSQLEANGIPVEHLGLKSPWLFPFHLVRLAKLIRRAEPDVIQGWMYHGNLAAYFSGRRLGVPIVWNIRQSLHRFDLFKSTTRLAIKANARYSGCVDSVIYNSQVARQQHQAFGFSSDNSVRIPNGVDLKRFRVGNSKRAVTREQLGIGNDERVIISVGRVHPIKGHDILLRSMLAVIDAVPTTRFVVVGRGADWSLMPFSRYQTEPVIRRHAMLLGERSDIVELLYAADVFISPSETEGFPNAVAEAMAACLPCVVTDVGDCALLVNDCGVVVPSGDSKSLATGLLQVLNLSDVARATMGTRAAARIQAEFSLPAITNLYAAHYRDVLARKSSGN